MGAATNAPAELMPVFAFLPATTDATRRCDLPWAGGNQTFGQGASRRLIDVVLRPTDQARSFTAEPLNLTIVHEDDALLVLNKRPVWWCIRLLAIGRAL